MAGSVIETLGGRFFNLADPKPREVDLYDISVALSNQARFNGLTSKRYSIAEHAILTMRLVIAAGHPELALPALHHDSHEAYMGDLTTPFKRLVDEQAPGLIREIALKLDDAIGVALDLDPEDFQHPVVKTADREALRQEARVLKHSGGTGEHWGYDEPPVPFLGWTPGLDPEATASLFRRLHHQLRPDPIAQAA